MASLRGRGARPPEESDEDDAEKLTSRLDFDLLGHGRSRATELDAEAKAVLRARSLSPKKQAK